MLVSENSRFKGVTMDKVMAERLRGREPAPDLLDEFFDFPIEEDGSVGTVHAHHTEEDMNLALRQPWCSVGSDGPAFAADGPLRRCNPHPRNFGTFPRLLGKYVRERGLLRLVCVILNGQLVLDHERHTGARPGRALWREDWKTEAKEESARPSARLSP